LVQLSAFPAAGQYPVPDETDPDDAGIVVEGERRVDISAAGGLVREVAARPRSREPLPRLNDPLCLQLAIDDEERGRLIGRRVIANARAVDLEIGKRGCRPNALVIIADDMRKRIDERRREGRGFFLKLKRHQIDRALKVRDPVYVFHDIFIKTNRFGAVDRNSRKDLIATAVMIENRVAAGFSTDQIADFVALRLLAPVRELSELETAAPRTILSLFLAPESAPPEMTRLDRAYLETLYRLPANTSAVDVLLATSRVLAEDEAEQP
jgi:hypothetical protein